MTSGLIMVGRVVRVDEKRARQILRDLAADGILQRADTDQALYRPAADPEQ
ncbi:hypothetical protein ACWCP8_34945 [Streptomyces sp. NPDC002206]